MKRRFEAHWAKRTLLKTCLGLGLITASLPSFASESSTPQERIPTEDLIEGIKSADGRWFDVEIILFERTRETNVRETFDQEVKNRKPRRFWDVQQQVLNPNLLPLLRNLPSCLSEEDPFIIAAHSAEKGLDISPQAFFSQYTAYKEARTKYWQIRNELCLLPSERSSPYWALTEPVNFLHQDAKNNGVLVDRISTSVTFQRFPIRPTGYDFDDFRGVYLLDEKNLKLTEQANTIDKHWNTKVLLHMGWRQPGLSPRNAIAMYLRAGENYSDRFRYDGTPITTAEQLETALPETWQQELQSDPAISSNDLLITEQKDNIRRLLSQLEKGAVIDPESQQLVFPNRQRLPKETWQLDGSVTVKLDHYLYFDARFNYREPQTKTLILDDYLNKPTLFSSQVGNRDLTSENDKVLITPALKDSSLNGTELGANEGTTAPTAMEVEYLQNFPFKQQRRTYSGDLHYLDHPKFGVLFQIRKYRH